MAKPGRNDRCPCGSGNKYKACCLPQDEAARAKEDAAQQAGRNERAAVRRPRSHELRKARAAITARLAMAATDLDDDA
jgi:hypothetical protein